MSCHFCKKKETHEILSGLDSAGIGFSFGGVKTCKGHTTKGRELVAKLKGGKAATHTRAQRISAKVPAS
jgi:hypothetical protein